MWQRFVHFVTYNNAFVFMVALAFSGAAGAFAASPDAREAVYSSTQTVLSVDNTYLLSVNLEEYAFNARVVAVTEDEEQYYVDYAFTTIEIVDYVWKDFEKTGQMVFTKQELLGRDLGLRVAEELGELVDATRAKLVETQETQRKAGESQKIVATEYSGLIGRFLSPDMEAFPGYDPVVDESLRFGKEDKKNVDIGNISAQIAGALANGGKVPSDIDSFQKGIATADNPLPGYPVITLYGNNPATIEVKSSYVDLGGKVEDDKDKDLTLDFAGEQIDTSKPGKHRVNYSVTDKDGNTTTAYRTVQVIDPYAIVKVDEPEAPAPSSASTSPAPIEPEPTPEPEPAPASEPEPQDEPVVETPAATSTPSVPAEEPQPTESATTTDPVPVPEPVLTESEPTPEPQPEPELPAPVETTTASSPETSSATTTVQ